MGEHVYGFTSTDPILGIRLGVNAADYANAKGLAPRGNVMRLAVQLADVQMRTAPKNARRTLRLENIKAAEIQCGGKKAERRQLEEGDLRRMVSTDAEMEAERSRIARARYAETKARKEAAAAAKKAERAAKRAAKKAEKEAAAS
jgi:hypothetical protein